MSSPDRPAASTKVQYEVRFPVHFPDGAFVHVSTIGPRDPDCDEQVGNLLIRITSDDGERAEMLAEVVRCRIVDALARDDRSTA